MNLPLRFLIASLFLLLVEVRPCISETLDNQLKTAYVLNFVKFTEWPATAQADGTITLCVVGKNVLGGILGTLEGRRAGRHELHVVHYSSETFFATGKNAGTNLDICQVVFIGESEQRRFIPLINFLADSPVLTISDIDDFAQKGGGIGLVYRNGKILFEINLASVQRSMLRLPGQVLNLASYIFRK